MHTDENDKGTAYVFQNPEQLLKDFYDRVNEILGGVV